MAFDYGFYNSVNHDRAYNAVQMSRIFDGIINDGVYMSVLDHFAVTAKSGMTISVGGGRAWFNHTWNYNDSVLNLVVSDSSIGLNRIDAVVLTVDSGERTNKIEVIEGVPVSGTPSKPDLVNTDSKYYYPLAYITIESETIEITQSDIENAVGTESTPFVTGIIETINIDSLIAQWGAEWIEWNNEHRQDYLDWVSSMESDMQNWTSEQKSEYETWITNQENDYNDWYIKSKNLFDTWFANIKDELDGDVAGHLQNEINEIIEKEFKRYYDIANRTTTFNEDGSIISIGDGVTATTTFKKENENTIIATVVTDSNLINYKETVIISGNVITESYEKM